MCIRDSDITIEGYVVSDFTTWDKTTVRAMGGLELLLADKFALRGGYRYDDGAKSHAVSVGAGYICLLYTSPSPRDRTRSRMPSSA